MGLDFNLLGVEEVLIFFLLVIAITTWIGNKLPIPYTVGLVVAGLVLAIMPVFESEPPEFTSELILALFLPPILFQRAYQLHARELRKNISLIVLLVTENSYFRLPSTITRSTIPTGEYHASPSQHRQ